MQETQVQPLGQEDPWRREWLPPPIFLPGEFHGEFHRQAWLATVCRAAKSRTQLKRLTHVNI